MHLTLGHKANFIAPIITTPKVTIFSTVNERGNEHIFATSKLFIGWEKMIRVSSFLVRSIYVANSKL